MPAGAIAVTCDSAPTIIGDDICGGEADVHVDGDPALTMDDDDPALTMDDDEVCAEAATE